MKRQRGSQSLEFAMIALPFVLLLLVIFELTRFLWINMVFDSAVNQAMRVARVMPPTYAANQSVKAKIASYPLLEEEKVELSVPRYAGSVSDLAHYRMTSATQAKLGQYTVNYHFSFLLIPKLSAVWKESMTLQRVMVVAYDH
ncbi:TadE/TadG family type IV pilus assembly protein [Vibrio ouci]|uniref:Pilus assembly protein n=1 Tax=Vibrio ouci TaxID=2499078 RepID=A0A4Y8WLU5_9VIBR|nr:TadE family protein [Vibrio ouci]TFH93248.1 pilus assembly protein [Vibrio ouci]